VSIKGPLRKDGVLSRKLGKEWMLFDPEKGAIHIINAMAEFVWNMCDGSHSLDEMERRLKDVYQVPDGANLNRDLQSIIQSFTSMGLLVSEQG
jgi:Mg2+/Co2+ transporter CorB